MKNELSNKYTLAALRERRSELAGELIEAERRVRTLQTALGHLDGTLTIMEPGYDPTTLPVRKVARRPKLFGQGKLNQMVLAALRRGARPMTTAEVTAAVAAEMSFGPEAEVGLKPRVRGNLVYLTKHRGLVVKDGDREAATWRLA